MKSNPINLILENLALNETKSIDLGNGKSAYQYGGKYYIKSGDTKKEISADQYSKLSNKSSSGGLSSDKSSSTNSNGSWSKDFEEPGYGDPIPQKSYKDSRVKNLQGNIWAPYKDPKDPDFSFNKYGADIWDDEKGEWVYQDNPDTMGPMPEFKTEKEAQKWVEDYFNNKVTPKSSSNKVKSSSNKVKSSSNNKETTNKLGSNIKNSLMKTDSDQVFNSSLDVGDLSKSLKDNGWSFSSRESSVTKNYFTKGDSKIMISFHKYPTSDGSYENAKSSITLIS